MGKPIRDNNDQYPPTGDAMRALADRPGLNLGLAQALRDHAELSDELDRKIAAVMAGAVDSAQELIDVLERSAASLSRLIGKPKR